MNKILRFSLLSLLTMLNINLFASTYSYTFTQSMFSAAGTVSLDGIDWTLATDAGYFGYDTTTANRGQQFGSSKSAAKTVTLSTTGISGTITSVKVNTSGASSIAATLDVTVGGTKFGNQYTLTATAADVEFTGSASGEISLNYTNSSAKALYIKSIVVTYASSGVTVKDPTFSLEAGAYTTAQTLTLSGDAGTTIYYTLDGTAPTNGSTKYVNPISISTTTTVKAIAYDANGKASNVVTKTYSIVPVCASIKEFKALTSGTVAQLTLTNAQVQYASGNDIYVKDATGGIDFYSTGITLTTGQTLNGSIIGKYTQYNGMPELAKDGTNTNDSKITTKDGTVTPITATSISDIMADAYACCLVKIVGATIDNTTTAGTTYAKLNGSQIIVYDKWKLLTNATIDTNATHTITGIIAPYGKSTDAIVYELYPTTIEGIVTNVNGITANDENANSPIYNLDGQRVNKSYKGVIIQNGKKMINK